MQCHSDRDGFASLPLRHEIYMSIYIYQGTRILLPCPDIPHVMAAQNTCYCYNNPLIKCSRDSTSFGHEAMSQIDSIGLNQFLLALPGTRISCSPRSHHQETTPVAAISQTSSGSSDDRHVSAARNLQTTSLPL